MFKKKKKELKLLETQADIANAMSEERREELLANSIVAICFIGLMVYLFGIKSLLAMASTIVSCLIILLIVFVLGRIL